MTIVCGEQIWRSGQTTVTEMFNNWTELWFRHRTTQVKRQVVVSETMNRMEAANSATTRSDLDALVYDWQATVEVDIS